MYKVWKNSSLILLAQIIVAGIIACLTNFQVGTTLAYFNLLLPLVLVIALALKHGAESPKIKNFLNLSTLHLANSFILLKILESIYGYHFYHFYHEFGITTSLFFIFVIVTLFVFGVYTSILIDCVKKEDENLNIPLTVLCSMPLGVGVIFGGVAGFLLRKF